VFRCINLDLMMSDYLFISISICHPLNDSRKIMYYLLLSHQDRKNLWILTHSSHQWLMKYYIFLKMVCSVMMHTLMRLSISRFI